MAKSRQKEIVRTAAKLKIFRDLLLWEATGGIIHLPKGAEGYVVPPIPFSERRAMLDSMNRDMLTSFKVDPKDEMSAFDILKENGDESAAQRKSIQDRDRGISSPDTPISIRGEPIDLSESPAESTPEPSVCTIDLA